MTARPVWPVVVIGLLAVLTVDTCGAILSELMGFSYAWLAIPTFSVFAAIGFVAGWRHSISAAAYAALVVSVVDVTLGWWISWQIGPGRIPLDESQDFLYMLFVAKLSIAIDTLLAIGAGAAARRLASRRALNA